MNEDDSTAHHANSSTDIKTSSTRIFSAPTSGMPSKHLSGSSGHKLHAQIQHQLENWRSEFELAKSFEDDDRYCLDILDGPFLREEALVPPKKTSFRAKAKSRGLRIKTNLSFLLIMLIFLASSSPLIQGLPVSLGSDSANSTALALHSCISTPLPHSSITLRPQHAKRDAIPRGQSTCTGGTNPSDDSQTLYDVHIGQPYFGGAHAADIGDTFAQVMDVYEFRLEGEFDDRNTHLTVVTSKFFMSMGNIDAALVHAFRDTAFNCPTFLQGQIGFDDGEYHNGQ